MSYAEKYRELANDIWSHLHKGSLFNEEGEIRDFTGLSGGEGVIYQVCKAIAEPETYCMPRLDDVCHRLSETHQKRIISALSEMFLFRC